MTKAVSKSGRLKTKKKDETMKKRLTAEQIKAKEGELIAELQNALKEKKGRKSQAKEFLLSIKGILRQAIDSGLSYNEISRRIKKVYGVTVSPTTIRTFAYTELGVQKKKQNNHVHAY